MSKEIDYEKEYKKYKLLYDNCKREIYMEKKRYGRLAKNMKRKDCLYDKYDFYFYHYYHTDEALLNILKDGYLRPSNDIKHRRFSPLGEKLYYIYTSMYIQEVERTHHFGMNLFLHPKLIEDYGFIFNKGWTIEPNEESIVVNKDDPMSVRLKKVDEMKEWLGQIEESVEISPGYFSKRDDIMGHEVLWSEPIPLRKYLIAVAFEQSVLEPQKSNYQKNLKEIKRLLKKMDLDIPIIENPHQLPSLQELL